MDAEDLRAFGEDAAEAGEALWGATVKIGGVEYPAEVPVPRVKGMLVAGGEALEAELVVRIRKAVCETCPAREKELLHDNKKWIIREATGNTVDAVWTLRCEPKN
jgi:hypothetical protein